MRLDSAANNFERNQVDTFAVRGPDLGPLTAVVVQKEGRGLTGDWHLQQVEVMHPGEEGGSSEESKARFSERHVLIPLALDKKRQGEGRRRHPWQCVVVLHVFGEEGRMGMCEGGPSR